MKSEKKHMRLPEALMWIIFFLCCTTYCTRDVWADWGMDCVEYHSK